MSEPTAFQRPPRTAREALIAELLCDVQEVLDRVDAIKVEVKESEESFVATLKALDEGSDRFRMAVTSFTEDAKRELASASARATAKTVEEQRSAMQAAAREAFQREGFEKVDHLRHVLDKATQELDRTRYARMIDSGIVALVAAMATAVLIHFLK